MTDAAEALPTSRLAAALAVRGIHYGWVVVGVTFLTMLATAGALGSAGVMIEPLKAEFGWSTAEISIAFAIRLVLFGLMGPFAAALMNRFGLRPVVVVALGLISGSLLLSLGMTARWQLMLLWGVLAGMGTGMTALVLGATVATRWFVARRGLVVGLLTASTATGQLVFLPLLAGLASAHGWRVALMLTIGALLCALVLAGLFLRDRPADVGLLPFGATEAVPQPMIAPGLRALLWAPVGALLEAGRSEVFWVLALTFFVCGLSTNGLIQTHWIALCGDFGLVPVTAASVLALIGIFDLVGTVGSGWLADRFDNRWLLFWYYGLRGLSLIFLSSSDFSLVALSVFGVFYGLDWVATVPPTVKLTADRFGAARAGLVFGWVFAAHQLGAAVAAFGAGASRTSFDTYLPALYVAGAFCLVAAGLVITLKRPGSRIVAARA